MKKGAVAQTAFVKLALASLMRLAQQHRLPAVYRLRQFVAEGGLTPPGRALAPFSQPARCFPCLAPNKPPAVGAAPLVAPSPGGSESAAGHVIVIGSIHRPKRPVPQPSELLARENGQLHDWAELIDAHSGSRTLITSGPRPR